MKRPSYTPEEQAKVDALNRRIDAGDVVAYDELTKLASSVVKAGRRELVK